MKSARSNKAIRVSLGSIVGAASLAFVGAGTATAATTAEESGQSAVVMAKDVNDWG